jgi:hypothetical protein
MCSKFTFSYLDKVLFDHVVEGGRDAVHGNGGVAHAQDTVELRRHEGHPRLRHRLREYLILDVFACLKRAEKRQLLSGIYYTEGISGHSKLLRLLFTKLSQ